jgi:hypothetical protein
LISPIIHSTSRRIRIIIISSRVWVPTDGIWIGYWIYWQH